MTSAYYPVSVRSPQPSHMMPQDKEPEINYTNMKKKMLVRIGFVTNFYSGTGYIHFKVIKNRRNSWGKTYIDQKLLNIHNGWNNSQIDQRHKRMALPYTVAAGLEGTPPLMPRAQLDPK